MEGTVAGLFLANNPRIDSAVLQERLDAEIARHSSMHSAPAEHTATAARPVPTAQASLGARTWIALRTAAMNIGVLRVAPLRTALLWSKSLLLLQRTRAEVKRSTATAEQVAAQLQAVQDRVLEMERARVAERDQEAERRAELEIRLATAEHALAAHAESMGTVLRSLEERIRSAAATASVRLNDAEAALTRLQRHVDGEASASGATGGANGEEAVDAGAAPAGHTLCAPARMDALFLEMSYAFRGSRDEIKGRVARHLPEVLAAVGQGGQCPILDIGCGRGEWLEVLRDAQVPARGVDTSQACVALCIDHGLSVTQADGLAALGETPDGTLGGVSALHVVEHLPFDGVVRLIDEAHRCIAGGGVLLLETPNPESLMVGGRTFFFDPTHRMPIPPDVLALVVRERGFTEVRVERMHPYPREYHLPGEAGEAERVLNQLLYGPQDYCIVARRP